MTRRLLTANAGRGMGAGARLAKRTLDRDDVLARQAHWREQPASPERDQALIKARAQLRNIANRVGNPS